MAPPASADKIIPRLLRISTNRMVAAPAIVPTATLAVGAQLVACGAGNDPATGVVRGAAVDAGTGASGAPIKSSLSNFCVRNPSPFQFGRNLGQEVAFLPEGLAVSRRIPSSKLVKMLSRYLVSRRIGSLQRRINLASMVMRQSNLPSSATIRFDSGIDIM